MPQSLSSWRFRRVILTTSSSREYVGRLGRITIAPDATEALALAAAVAGISADLAKPKKVVYKAGKILNLVI